MYPAIFNPTNTVYGPLYGTDNRGTIWRFWWMKYSFKHYLPYDVNSMIAHPFGVVSQDNVNPYVYTSFYRSLSVLTNEIFSYNLGIFLSFILSGFFVYLVVYKVSGNRLASFISGLIFSFSPYHFNKAWEHFSLAQIQWIPLYVLSLLYLKDKVSIKRIFLSVLAFSLVMHFDFYYAYIMAMLTLCFGVFVLLYKLKDKAKVTIALFLVILLALIINIPLLYPIFKSAFFAGKTASVAVTDTYVRSFNYLFSQSARILSYLLPSVSHPIFGSFTKSMLGSIFYGRGTIEQTLYLGWVGILLSFLAYRIYKRRRGLKDARNEHGFVIGFFIFFLIVCFLFSMPPYFNLGIFKIYFPSFFMYKILPMFRAYARFGVGVLLSVSILAGLGLSYILDKIKSNNKKLILTIFIGLFVLFEFLNVPSLHCTSLKQDKAPEAYQWLSNQNEDFAIAEYPLSEAGFGEAFMNYDYLLYQRIHQKKLVNGAKLGTHAYKIKKMINNVSSSKTPKILKWLGVKYVLLHVDSYKRGEVRGAMDILGQVPNLRKVSGFKFIKKFDNIEVYEVIAKPINPTR